MEILYYGFDGGPFIVDGVICIIVVIVMIIMGILSLTTKERLGAIIAFALAVIFVIGSIVIFSEERIPIIKTIFTEEIPWQEVNSKYTLIEQEGKIYTFQVNNMTTKEWEKIIKENSKEN